MACPSAIRHFPQIFFHPHRGRGQDALATVGALVLVLVLGLGVACLPAAEAPGRTDWQILCEPAVVKPPHAEPLAGSREIFLSPGIHADWSWRTMPEADFSALGVELPEFQAQALRNLLPLLDEIEPQYYRDAQEVIEYGILRIEGDPRLGALILLPEFYRKFEPIFGPDFLAVIPNTSHIFLFPRLASTLDQHSAMLLRQYELRDDDTTALKLSKEIFVIGEDGARIVGRLLDPRTDPAELFHSDDESLGLPEEAEPESEKEIDVINKLRP